jgi:hypothetical protein
VENTPTADQSAVLGAIAIDMIEFKSEFVVGAVVTLGAAQRQFSGE